jgi:hypothetical protein
MNQSPSKHNPYAGLTTCLRCDREFQSWDRRHNRLCPHCLEALEQEPSDEPPQPMPVPMRRFRQMDDA